MASTKADAGAKGPTPMMQQYFALKREAEGCLLFYRMGDFFELFFEDAKQAAAILDIALTSRGEHDGQPVAMCGVPVHAAEGYLARLIKAGCRVAIAEQIETPEEAKKRGGYKALVARDIVRFVTAGWSWKSAPLKQSGQRWRDWAPASSSHPKTGNTRPRMPSSGPGMTLPAMRAKRG